MSSPRPPNRAKWTGIGGELGQRPLEIFAEKLGSHLFKSCKDNQGVLAWSHGVGEEALMESLCGRYGIWIVPLFKVLPGFRWRLGAVENASIYLRRYRRLQKLTCSTMRVDFIIGKT